MILFALIPLFAIISGVLVYNQNGKKEILRFDFVQFFYAFILMPTVFIWFKSFLFFLLQNELFQKISPKELFFWDTAYSVFFLFIFAFTVIHSLTKSFELKRRKDPLYDLFEHSEYYHLWVSHTIIFTGAMILVTGISLGNIFIDSLFPLSQNFFYGLLLTAPVLSAFVFKAFQISDFGDFRFLKLMKFFVGIFFVVHGVFYSIYEPLFSPEKVMYWYMTVFFGSSALIGFFHSPEPKPLSFRKRLGSKARLVVKKLTRR